MNKLDRLLESLPDNEATTLQSVLFSSVPSPDLATTLRTHGHDISEAAIRRWRQKYL